MIRGYRKTFVHQEESRKADKEIGEIDLLGLDIADRLWVVELKVAPNTDTPLKRSIRVSATQPSSTPTVRLCQQRSWHARALLPSGRESSR